MLTFAGITPLFLSLLARRSVSAGGSNAQLFCGKNNGTTTILLFKKESVVVCAVSRSFTDFLASRSIDLARVANPSELCQRDQRGS